MLFQWELPKGSCKSLTPIQSNGNLSMKMWFKKMLIHVMHNRLASYLDEKFHQGNQHNSFCMTCLLWDPMVKKNGVKWGYSFSVHCV